MIVEHRDYMRVDDRLVISWRPAEGKMPEDYELRDVMIMSVNRQINDMMAAVESTQPAIAKLLMQLNHKIDLLSEHAQDAGHGPNLVRVNISRAGMAFDWKTSIDINQNIRIWITLPPENTKVMVRAAVLACEDIDGNGRCRVRCQFSDGQDEALDYISHYIDNIVAGRDMPSRLKAPVGGSDQGVSSPEVVPLPSVHQKVLYYR